MLLASVISGNGRRQWLTLLESKGAMVIFKWLVGVISLGMSTLALGNGLTTNVVSYPLYSLIGDTLVKMVPVVNDRRNAFMMQLICDLARDDKTQKNVNEILVGKGVDIGNIPHKDNPMSLLVNGDKLQQKKVCLAYIATTLFYPQDNDFLFDVSEGKDKEPKRILNLERLEREMKIRMATAEATAQLYAVIAKNIIVEKQMSFSSYRKQINEIAMQYAPVYFQSIRLDYDENHGGVKVISLRSVDFTIADTNGRMISFIDGNFNYSKRGVNWLGNGDILGKSYFVDVAVFSMEGNNKEKVRGTKQL